MARILVVGAGVVGQATGKGLIEHGHDVSFVDVSTATADKLTSEGYHALAPKGMNLLGVDVVFVSVPTPSGEEGLRTGCLDEASQSIGEALGKCDDLDLPVVAFRSTMVPGTTRDRLIPKLESASGKQAGVDFGVCYNPEYLRAHNAHEDFHFVRVVTIGGAISGDEASHKLFSLYESLHAPVHHYLTYEEAEFQKYVHNNYNAAKITFFNEMRLAAEELGIDPGLVFEITGQSAQGMWDELYGTGNKGPYGGACLPKDMAAWLSFAKERGIPTPVQSAIHEFNSTLEADK